jgi:hypothetical protein
MIRFSIRSLRTSTQVALPLDDSWRIP